MNNQIYLTNKFNNRMNNISSKVTKNCNNSSNSNLLINSKYMN